MIGLFLWTLVSVLLLLTVAWAVSVPLRKVSIVDVFWGLGFVFVAGVSLGWAEGRSPWSAWQGRWLAPVLTMVWGLRLACYLAWRQWGEREDRRYAKFRERTGPTFWWKSLMTVFWLQAGLLWIISWPLQAGVWQAQPGSAWLWIAGLLWWLTGFSFETIGDWQLARFRAQPENRGRILQTGLWAWTRHPNYFGDFCVWWGLFLICLSAGAPWWTVAGPVLLSILLLRVSGVTLLEESLKSSRPEYAEYQRRTSAFFPWPPQRLK